MADANVKAVITADDKASATLRKFGDSTSRMSSKVKAGFKVAAVAIAAAAAAVIAFGVSSVRSFMESEDSLAQLNAVLKSTKGVAGVTAKAAINLADSLQKVTKFSDEEVIAAENLLLTFTKIGKDIFPQATKTVLDMSTALGQDTKSSAIQLGKALQDPILGITALRRVGVNFNEAQKETVKRMVETGQQGKAQAYILKELQTEFGGSAVAAGETFSGKLKILGNMFDEVKEKIGGFIANGLLGMASAISKIDFATVTATINSIRNAAIQLVNFLSIQWKATWDVVRANSGSLKKAFSDLWTTITTQLIPSMKELWRQVGPVLGPALKTVGKTIGVLLVSAILALAMAINIAAKALAIFNRLQAQTIATLRGVARSLSPLVSAFSTAFNTIIKLWNNTVGKIQFQIPDWVPGIGGKQFGMPRYASGTDYAKGGMALVGERGPEMVSLPRGSRVTPNNSVKGGNASSVNITIQAGAFMGSPQDARKYADMIVRAIQDNAQMSGLSVNQMLGA